MNAPPRLTDLRADLEAAVDLVTEADVERLEAAGVPCDVFYPEPPWIGVSPITTHRDGLYEPAEDGPQAVIVACYAPGWELTDLVAFHLDQPGRWWRRLGVADMLGEVNAGAFRVDPIRIEATPLDWLKDGGRGLCVLNWKIDPLNTLMGAGALCANPAIRRRLRARTVECAAQQLAGYFS